MFDMAMLASTKSWLRDQFLSQAGENADRLALMATIGIMLVLAILAYVMARIMLSRVVGRVVRRTKTVWDDAMYQSKFFFWLAQLAPGVVLYLTAKPMLEEPEVWIEVIQRGALIYMVLVGYLAVAAFLNGVIDIYRRFPVSKELPIRSFIQVAKLLLFLLAAIIVMCLLLDESPVYFLSGLGAITAVLMLIFKDAILGLVAGIQLAANRMVARGDWIEMPKYGADGNVIDIALTTVKVQNWDNTVTTVPTYALISDSFKNWRGMQESPGRRIKRSLSIDVNSIKFCDQALLKELRKINVLKEFLKEREQEIAKSNKGKKGGIAHQANLRQLTNIGMFRAYVRVYVESHPMINQDLTVLVRQLAPTEHGLPIEIYVFSKDKNWVNYESIQADLFDHFFAILPEFHLRAYQRPAGADLKSLTN